MGILSGIFKVRDKPENSTAGSSYRFFLGTSTSGKNVNERSAMQMTAVYSCVRILSEEVASLPLHFYKYDENGSKVKAIEHPLYILLHDEPNPEMTSFVFQETLMTHLLLWGNAYAQIIRNLLPPNGYVLEAISEMQAAEETEVVKNIYSVFQQLLNQNKNGFKISRNDVLSYDVEEIQDFIANEYMDFVLSIQKDPN